jgi:hypothetical protein
MKTLLIAAALAFSATAASAGTVKLPEEFLGTWCVADRNDELASLKRAGCDTRPPGARPDEVVIRQDSLDYGDRCKLVTSRRSPPYGNGVSTFVMFYRCGIGKLRNEWNVEMFMKHDVLFLVTKRGGR